MGRYPVFEIESFPLEHPIAVLDLVLRRFYNLFISPFDPKILAKMS